MESFTPIIIWGKPGSYKSYTAAAIALLKHYLIDAGIESIADIDYEQNIVNKITEVFKFMSDI